MRRIIGTALQTFLEWTTILLMVSLAVVVIVGVFFRMFGSSLSWYDEVAAIQLSWVTYYGAALAALRRRHIGFDSVLLSLPMPWRMGAVVVAEVIVIGFFYLMATTGLQVLEVLQGDRLVSLTWMPVQITQSVIPIGAVLFILAELISLPDYWRSAKLGNSLEHPEIHEEERA
jgi:TRAP-type C4-dicarboxylate transport system permease small subunit